MRPSRRTRRLAGLPLLVAAVVSLSACAGGSDPTLSPAGEAGKAVAIRLGCTSCHGSDGRGVEDLGPSLKGLPGTTVSLTDGRTMVRDRAYLERSIVEPEVELVGGYTVEMPAYRLEPDDLEALLTYLDDLR